MSSTSSSDISDPPSPVLATTEVITKSADETRRIQQSFTITHLGTDEVTHEVLNSGKSVNLKITAIPSKGQAKGKKVKVKHIVSFQPRFSAFDRLNPATQNDHFRGFYTLFWILLGIHVINTLRKAVLEENDLLTFQFGKLISKDGLLLAASDGVMVGSTFLAVPFVKVKEFWFSYHVLD
jgi:sterol O-acyltransferase